MKIGNLGYVDLFSGIGGFAAIFEALDLESKYCVEKDANAANTYAKNWVRSPLGDIVKDSDNGTFDKIEDHVILSAGFPCQPFSKSGLQLGRNDADRGNLFTQIEEILQIKKPRVIFLENVRNLAGPRHADYWNEIVNRLQNAGYRVSVDPEIFSPNRLAPHLGGRPQHRERVFILGTYIGDLKHEPADLIQDRRLIDVEPELQSFPLEMWETAVRNSIKKNKSILPFAPNASRSAISKTDRHVIDSWDLFLNEFRKNNPTSSFPALPIWSDTWEGKLNSRQEMPQWKNKLVTANEHFYKANKSWIDRWVNVVDFRSDLRFTPSTRKFEWHAGDYKSPWQGLIQFRPSGVRVKRISRFPALVAITQIPIIGPLKAYLSVSDAAFLQGLPEEFEFHTEQSKLTSYKQLGNGISVGIAWAVLKAHLKRDHFWLSKTPEGRELIAKSIEVGSDIYPKLKEVLGEVRSAHRIEPF